mmetsp:Transcript_26383/g.66314  ORF Transcript_26383/g.66314 Transcript_26383/m.66314 type:complete len:224 (+) Transcript_26383:3457-4128(+)
MASSRDLWTSSACAACPHCSSSIDAAIASPSTSTFILSGLPQLSSTRTWDAPSGTLNLRLSPSSQDTPLLCAFTHLNSHSAPGAICSVVFHTCPSFQPMPTAPSGFQLPMASVLPTSLCDSPKDSSLTTENSTSTSARTCRAPPRARGVGMIGLLSCAGSARQEGARRGEGLWRARRAVPATGGSAGLVVRLAAQGAAAAARSRVHGGAILTRERGLVLVPLM